MKPFIMSRVKEAAKELRELERDDRKHFEGVYRCFHHSYKIEHMRWSSLRFLFLSLYILGILNDDIDDDELAEILPKCIKKKTYLWYMYNKVTKDNLPKKSVWIPTEVHSIRYCGYYYFFKTTLEGLLEYAKKGRPKSQEFIEFYEGIKNYFVSSTQTPEEKT